MRRIKRKTKRLSGGRGKVFVVILVEEERFDVVFHEGDGDVDAARQRSRTKGPSNVTLVNGKAEVAVAPVGFDFSRLEKFETTAEFELGSTRWTAEVGLVDNQVREERKLGANA